jgi:RNase P subunit RPR2
MIPDYLQDALMKMNEALIDQQFDSLIDSTTITLDVQAAMVLYEAAKAYHREGVARESTNSAITVAQCKGTIARLPKIERCTCKTPKLPVGFFDIPTGEKIICQKCKRILLTRTSQ